LCGVQRVGKRCDAKVRRIRIDLADAAMAIQLDHMEVVHPVGRLRNLHDPAPDVVAKSELQNTPILFKGEAVAKIWREDAH